MKEKTITRASCHDNGDGVISLLTFPPRTELFHPLQLFWSSPSRAGSGSLWTSWSCPPEVHEHSQLLSEVYLKHLQSPIFINKETLIDFLRGEVWCLPWVEKFAPPSQCNIPHCPTGRDRSEEGEISDRNLPVPTGLSSSGSTWPALYPWSSFNHCWMEKVISNYSIWVY